MNLPLIPLLVIGGLVIFYVDKLNAVNSLVYNISSINTTVNGGNVIITVALSIFNPTPQSFIINSLNGYLLVNSMPYGQVMNFAQTRIIQGTTIYPITIVSNILNDVNNIAQSLINGAGTGLNVSLVGTANIESLNIPFSVNYKL